MSSSLTNNRIYFANLASGLILDCGCGVGSYSSILKKRGEVVGGDINKDYLINSPYEHKILCSATNLPFQRKVFDFVWASGIIEHVKQDCIKEIIYTGKSIVFLTPNKNSPLELLRKLIGKKGTWEIPDHVRLYTIGELKEFGKIYGTSCGLPKRSFWLKILPKHFWFYTPALSHDAVLWVQNCY